MNIPNLLLVLDHDDAIELQKNLELLGYLIVDCISDGEQAIKQAAALRPDLVLININLERGKSGIETGMEIYEQFDIPIIYLSDQSSHNTIRRSGGTAPFGYLFKPFDGRQALAIIELALTRHRLEKKVRDSESWLNAILENIGDGVIALGLDRRIRFLNPVAETLINLNASDAKEKLLSEVLTLTDETTHEILQVESMLDFDKTQRRHFVSTAHLRTKDGSEIPVEVQISPIQKDNQHLGSVLVIHDISEQRAAMREIRMQANRAEAMVLAAAQLNSRLDIQTIFDTVCGIIRDNIGGISASAFYYDKNENCFVDMAFVGTPNTPEKELGDTHVKIPSALFESFLSPQNPITVVEDIEMLELTDIAYVDLIREQNIRTLAVAGLFQNDKLIGTLIAKSQGNVREFTSSERELLKGLADQTAIAVANASLFSQVRASRERQQLLTRRLVAVQEDERRKLALELHDQIGQIMTGLQFTINSLMSVVPPEKIELVADAQNTVSALIAQTREISINLRPSMLDDMGLQMTLFWHFDRYTSRTDIKVDYQFFAFDERFDTQIETAVFRIIQEALTNVARYAKTKSVEVKLAVYEEVIQVTIKDHGVGFDPEKLGKKKTLGLNSMRERAYSLGGLLKIKSAPQKGTTITASIPLNGLMERRENERNSFVS